jgi:hypothetical protein
MPISITKSHYYDIPADMMHVIDIDIAIDINIDIILELVQRYVITVVKGDPFKVDQSAAPSIGGL